MAKLHEEIRKEFSKCNFYINYRSSFIAVHSAFWEEIVDDIIPGDQM